MRILQVRSVVLLSGLAFVFPKPGACDKSSHSILPARVAAERGLAFLESDEVVTLLACVALGSSEASDGREKAATWLAKNEPTDTTQAAGFRLLAKLLAGKRARDLRKEIDQFRSRQNRDGGWSQVRELP